MTDPEQSEFGKMLRQAAGSKDGTSLTGIFKHEPVTLTVFMRDKVFLNNPPLSNVQYEAVRHIERVYLPDLYPRMAREFESNRPVGSLLVGPYSAWRAERYWSERIRMVNFATLQWGKGSSSINTPVYNSRNGRWIRLGDWTTADQVASAYPQDGKVFAAQGSAAFREGHGRMFRVRTRKGHEMEVWEGHRFLTWQRRTWPGGQRVSAFADAGGASWQRLWDMRAGDPIAIATSVPEPSECLTDVPDRDVELVGLWLGDGCMKSGNQIVCGVDAPVIRAHAAELFGQFPDTTVVQKLVVSGGSRRWYVQPKATGAERWLSGPVHDVAQRYGLARKTALHKAVPEQFYSLDNRQVALLLSRLIDTDGWVSFSNTAEIGYGTVSKELAIGVQRLMLRLGAVAELKAKTGTCQNCAGGDRHASYQLRVRDRRSLQALAGRLSLLDKEPKRLALLDWLTDRADRKQRAVHGDLMWDKIESIEYVGEDDYWTLSVDGPACFITSNGTLDHNSGKDHVARVASMRIAYLLLCLRSPQDYFGMPAQDTIHLLNVASSSQQAQQAFFTPITRAVRHSAFFKDLCQPRQNVVSFHSNLEMISGHSDAETQEGLNLILGIADEIDAFKSKKETQVRKALSAREPTKSAESILKMMRTSGSPQPLDALVLTPDRGFVRMGELCVGDRVVDPAGGSASAVVAIHPQGVQPVYRLSFSDGTSAEATQTHRWEMTRRGSELRSQVWTTEQMRAHLSHRSYADHPLALPETQLHHVDLGDGSQLPVDPYLLGLLLGAGGLTQDSPTFTTSDDELRRRCELALPPGVAMPYAGSRSAGGHSWRLVHGQGRRNPLTEALRELGLWGSGSGDTFIPKGYLLAGAKDRLSLLRGLMDTDGHAGAGTASQFGSVSRQLREDVAWLARSLGLRVRCPDKAQNAASNGERHIWRAVIRETDEVRIFSLARKAARYRSVRASRRTLTSVDYVRDAECQCIEVSAPSHLYVTDNFVPTHNTRFPSTFKNVRISFPRYLGSTIQRLTDEGRKDIAEHGQDSRYYVSGPLATWDVNPRVPGRSSFAADYREDPVMARAMYECKPSRAINPYFRNKHAVDACFAVSDHAPIGVTYGLEDGARQPMWVPRYEFAEDFFPVRGAAYAMHADLAISGDRAGIAMAHVIKYAEHQTLSEDEDGAVHALVESRPHVKVDFVIAYSADVSADPPREIQIRWARQLCMELIRRGFNVQRFSFDSFQSSDSMQILEARGIETERVSTDTSEDPWRTLRDMMYEGRVEIPRPPVPAERSFLLRDELLSLTRLPNGRVDHPTDGSKDLADALSCAVYGAIHLGGEEEGTGARAIYGAPDIEVGHIFDMPLGVNPMKLWERQLPGGF